MGNEKIFKLFFIAIFLSVAGAWFISKYGHHFDLLDKPNGHSSHTSATPKGGGIGILAAFILLSFFLKLPVTFWMPAAILSIVSFLGDRFDISPLIRLLSQFAASVIFLMGSWNNHPLLSNSSTILPIGLSIYIVATANYYNFMDGINGIAGISGIVGFALLSFYEYYNVANPMLIPLNISMALCCLAYLPFNIPKAKVFMGDTGSILLGFIFAVMVIWLSKNLLDFICLASFLFPFYADEVTTELARLIDGEKIWIKHRRHLYQILANECNISHWKVSLGYGIAQLFVGISLFFVLKIGLTAVVSVIALYFSIFFVLSTAIRRSIK